MMRFLPATFIALFALIVVALPANGAGTTAPTGSIGTGIGVFQVACGFSHRLKDDPIVFPRGPGASHLHDFFGTTTANAFSTPESISQGPTSCGRTDSAVRDLDKSAYWVPALYNGDRLVQATQLSAYYTSGIRDVKAIEPFPVGLQVIAGTATGGPQEINAERVWYYECPETLVSGTTTKAPTCKTNRLDLEIIFPDCWNGVSLDSPDHKSHMAYSRRAEGATYRTCPSTHPRLVPSLHFKLRYPTTGGPGVRLASGAINTAHADFVNGWDPAEQRKLVRYCLNVDTYCGGGDPVLPAPVLPAPTPTPTPVPGH